MTKRGTINSFQLFAILFLCRIIALFTYIIPTKTELTSGDKPLKMLPFLIICLIASIPAFMLLGRGNSGGVIGRANSVSPLFGKATGIFYAAVFLWTASVNVARFELFVSTVMFSEANMDILTVILLVLAVFTAVKGIEAMGRGSVIILFLLTASVIFIVISVIENFEFMNLEPPAYYGLTPMLDDAFAGATRTMEIATLLVASGFTDGKIKKGAVMWIATFSLCAFFIFTVIYGVTGEYGEQQMFQLYTLTVLARFGIFERMDDAIIGIWVLCALIKTAFYIFLAGECLKESFSVKPDKKIYAAFSIVIMLVYLRIARTITEFSDIMGHTAIDVLFVVATVAVPLAVFIIYKIKSRREGATAQ